MMIAIIDYGVGNLFSLSSSLKAVGADVIITGKKEDLEKADKLILPGVGAFKDAEDEEETHVAATGEELLSLALPAAPEEAHSDDERHPDDEPAQKERYVFRIKHVSVPSMNHK